MPYRCISDDCYAQSGLRSPVAVRLEQTLSEVWNDGADTLRLLGASPGQWVAREGCQTPRLWVLLTGLYRTMSSTQQSINDMARISSDGCYMVVAMLPAEIEKPEWWAQVHPSWHNTWARHNYSVESLLRDAQARVFGGHLAFAVVKRSGDLDRFPGCLPPLWQGVWAIAQWAAGEHALALSADAVVLRSMPDIAYRHALELGPLQRYFRLGTRGRHLLLGNEGEGRQGSEMLVTSAGEGHNE